MSTTGDQELIAIAAGADLSSGCQYKVIDVGGTISAANSAALGILKNKPKLGESATIVYAGHAKVYAGAAITAGNRLKTTTSGYVVAVASGDGACGKAIKAANSGSLVEGIFDFAGAATTY